MTSGEDLPERAVVVLDTTEFHGARRLDSKAWRRLLELSHEGKLDVGIPEVVLRETERHFRSDFTRAVKDLRKSATAFQILSEPASEIVEQAHLQISNKIDVETEIEAVRHRLEEHRVAVLPLPETSAVGDSCSGAICRCDDRSTNPARGTATLSFGFMVTEPAPR